MHLDDHPERFVLAAEVHARPPAELAGTMRASYVAVLIDPACRPAERDNLVSLCTRYNVVPPTDGVTHFSARFGQLQLKWERHGEFSGYSFFVDGEDEKPFEHPATDFLPDGWLQLIPGHRLVAIHAILIASGERHFSPEALARIFAGNQVVGAAIGGGAGLAYTDFRIHVDGYSRIVLLNRSMLPRQAGRMMQRLFEIEAYRMLALLALPLARRQAPQVLEIERALSALTEKISSDFASDEMLLHELTRFAADVERILAVSQFRLSASRAYYDLVKARIEELREDRLSGVQTINEFMARRLEPAMSSCATVSRRLRELSERIARTSSLLLTRVEIACEKQNQALLASMDRRAHMQLRLQQAVEGLSVAAISYYIAALLSLVFKALEKGVWKVPAEIATAIAIPFVVICVVLTVHRARKKMIEAGDFSNGKPHG